MLQSHMPYEVRHVIKTYVLAAGATGAMPLPGSSVAITAETAAMLAKIAAATGKPIDTRMLIRALGLAGTVNVFGRQVFVEFARAISWGAGMGIAGSMLISGFGATTAAMQTFLVGWLAYEIARCTDDATLKAVTAEVIRNAKVGFAQTYALWKKEKRESERE